MADTIFDNTLDGTQRTIQATSGVLTLKNAGTDNSYSIGPGDSFDYYKLTVSRSSNVTVKLNPQAGDLDLAVLDAGGNPILGRTANNPNGMADAVVSDDLDPLQPGQTYYIRVSGTSETNNNYTLTVETNPLNRADILWRNASSGAGSIWLMNGTQRVGLQTGPTANTSWQLSELGDLNGDGTTDYIWHNRTTGVVGAWLMDTNNQQVLSTASLPSVSTRRSLVAVGDFGGNSSNDLIWQDRTTGQAGVWIMNGTKFVSNTSIQTLSGAGWYIEAAADFNQDGKQDLFFRNSRTGQNVIWTMNGTSFSASTTLPSRAAGWRMHTTADFDGDGDQDLLWRNYSTGATDVWFMDKTTSVGSANIGNASTSWLIAGVIKSVALPDLAGNTSATAFNIGKLNGTATYSDDIGGTDGRDFYSFTLDAASKVGITARGTNISALADFEILAADGTKVLGSATANGADEEKLAELNLAPGTYYVRATSQSSTKARYVLDISAEALGSNLLFPTSPPDVTTLKRTDGTVITSTTPISVKDPFQLDLEYAVTYKGSSLSQFEVGFYLSVDGTFDSSDRRFDLNGSGGVGDAADVAVITGASPDTRVTRTQRLTLPKFDDPFWTNRGSNTSYNIIIVLDPQNKIQEVDPVTRTPAENDNTFATALAIEQFRPDLTPVNFNVTQSSSTRGGQIDLSGFISNIGTAKSDTGKAPGTKFEVRFYLSTDTTFSSATDIQLSTTPRPLSYDPLNAGSQTSIGTTVTAILPTTWTGYTAQQPGSNYYVLMVVDPSGTVNEIPGGTLNNVVSDVITIPFS